MKKLLTLMLLVITSLSSFAQLSVSNGYTATELGNILAGDNIEIMNASVTGDALQYGAFTFQGEGLDVNSGVILSSGNIFDAVGPNYNGGTSTAFGGPGNPLLSQLAGGQTNDAVVLEFQFDVQSDEIEFNFIFFSEEYNEWVGSGFNDVFAFYISGPGIDGEENLAVVPGTTVPVSINTINSGSFWQFYVDNTFGEYNVEYDGFTTLMTARKDGLQSCQTYTLKLMIADTGDEIYDAGVMLQENSLVQANVSASSSTYSDNNVALEGCIEADFTFQLTETVDYDVEIPLEFSGTALNGVDYKYIDPMIIIPAGQQKATIIIESYSDGMTEGQETIELVYSPRVCEEPDTVSLFIDDFQPIEFNATETNAGCNGGNDGEALFNITGGFAPYTIWLEDTITNEVFSYTDNPVTNLEAGIYRVEIIDDYGCKADDIVFGDIYNAGTTFLPTGTGVTYETSIEVSGFDEGDIIENLDQFKQISATMEHSYANDLSVTLRAPDGTEVLLKAEGDGLVGSNPHNSCDMGEPVASGIVDEWNANNITPGIGYEYVWNTEPTYGTMTDMVDDQLLPYHTYISTYGNELSDYYYAPGSYTPEGDLSDFVGAPLNGTWTIIVTDFYILDNGYIFEWSLSLSAPQSDSIITIDEAQLPEVTAVHNKPACGASNGEIDISVSGNSPQSYLWSNGATSEDLTGIPAGAYDVDITMVDDCVYNYAFNLSNDGTLELSGDALPETCVGADDGSIDLTVLGGTPGFTYNWSNGETSEDISDLTPDDYTVAVNDSESCSGIETFTVESAAGINLTANITHEQCGDEEGIINLSVSGGVAPYTFLWSSGQTTEDIDELTQGNYTVTITDQNGCSAQAEFEIINYVGNCVPDCDIEITNALIADENCGLGNGSIDLTVFTSNSPFTVQWSNTMQTTDISNLSAGEYTVNIEDAEGCTVSESYTVLNQTSGLNLSLNNLTDETCGNGQGAIDVTVTGGALPYTYNWSNGENTQDIDLLSAGEYTLVLTDANGCSVSQTWQIDNNSGNLAQTWGNAVNEICGNSQGSVDILIEGGNPYYSYSWNNGATTEDLMNVSAGTYYCVVTDQSGCSVTTETYVVENEGGTLEIYDTDVDNEVCGNANGEIEIYVSGGTTPYAFNWNNGETSQNLYNISAGNYSAVVTDNNGCSVNTETFTVLNEAGTLVLNEVIVGDELCGNSAGYIDISVAGGNQPYNYLWSNGSAEEDLTNISAGNYSCIITDGQGCEIEMSTTVQNDNGAIQIANITSVNETCGNGNGSIDILVTGAGAPVEYVWNSGQITEDITNISAGVYSCLLTDVNGCEASTGNITIQNDAGSMNFSGSVLTNEQCGNADGSIDITVTGGSQPLSFDWSNGETSEDLINLQAGSYSCVITDNDGCIINIGPFTVNNSSPSMQIADIVTTDESCGSGNGSIDITVSGGSAPLSFLWSNGADTEDLSDISAGIYDFTVTDSEGCSINGSAEVLNNAGYLNINSHIITHEICGNGNGAVNINLSGGQTPYEFLWSDGSTNEDLTGVSQGSYFVTITDAGGCEIVSMAYIVNNSAGAFQLDDISATDEYCNNGSGSIDAEVSLGTEPIDYLWSNGETTQDISDLSQGTYSCVATDANGCELTYSAVVYNQNGTLAVSDVQTDPETCGDTNGAIDLSISGGTQPYQFSWSNGGDSEDLINIGSGNYSCLITDDEGCTANATATVDDISGDFVVSNYSVTDEHCENGMGAVDISVVGGLIPYQFSWSNGSSDEDIMNLSAGDYTVIVTDDFGCEESITASVSNIPNALAIDNADIIDETCGNENGAIDISYSGAAEPVFFEWSNGDETEDISGLSSGNYSVTLTDSYNCMLTESFFVDYQTNGLSVTDAVVTDENCGNAQGAVDLTVSGGQEPYSFSWSNGAVSEDITDLAAGTYTCIITDSEGCEVTQSFEVQNVTNGLDLSLEAIENDYCNAGTGSIDITASGGNEPYTFFWNNGMETEDISNLTAGVYYVMITDADGCIYNSEHFTIENDQNPNLGFANIETTNDYCNTGTGSIDFDPAVPGNYIYELNGVQSNPPYGNLAAGSYVISIIEGNCRYDETVTVQSEGWYELVLDETGDENCGNQDGYINVSVYDGYGASYEYTWSNGANTQDIANLSAGTYTLNVIDEWDNCPQSLTATVNNIVSFNLETEVSNTTCGNADGAIDLTVSPVDMYSYLWSNGETTQDIDMLTAGTYTCEITNDDGCTETLSAVVENNQNNLTITADIENDVCELGQGSLQLNVQNAPMGYEVLWSNGETTNFIDNLLAGTYTATVTDIQYGCVQSESFTVGNDPGFTINASITNSTCETCADGAIDLTLQPTDSYSFSWSNGADTEDISELLPGDYTVSITNSDGCVIDDAFVVEYTIGLPELLGATVKIYPNPARETLVAEYSSEIDEPLEFSIYNYLGERIYESKVEATEGELRINVSDYAAGLYFIRIQQGTYHKTLKFVIEE